MRNAEDRRFILTVGSAFVVLAAIAYWRGRAGLAAVFVAIAAALLIIGVVAPRAVPPVRRAWMRGAHAISRVTTPIILGLVYYLVLTPTGLIRRALGRSSLRQVEPGESAWHDREPRARPAADMRRQF